MPLTSKRVETRASAVSKRAHKMPSLQQRIYEGALYWLELLTAYELNAQKEVTLKLMAWCDNPSTASVWHPDIPQYRKRHQFIPVRTSESTHTNLKITP